MSLQSFTSRRFSSSLSQSLFARAMELNSQQSRLVALPEVHDPRVIQAAVDMAKNNICTPLLIGKASEIKKNLATKAGKIRFLDPLAAHNKGLLGELADMYFKMKSGKVSKGKSMYNVKTTEEAVKFLTDGPFASMHFANVLNKAKYIASTVVGADTTSGEVARSAINCIGVASGLSSASSFFVMSRDTGNVGLNKKFIFADCGFIVNPSPEQLKDIALAAARTCTQVLGIPVPKVALLSFSTKGSAEHKLVDKVRNAMKLLKETNEFKKGIFVVDGEMQLDAAIIPEVCAKKAADSPMAHGPADVLVFPDLQAGNIGYKLAERLAGYNAVGPVFQGFSRPVSDLSRGCKAGDIVGAAAITVLQGGSKLDLKSSDKIGQIIE